MQPKLIKKLTLLVSITVFVVSLALPCFQTESSGWTNGITVFLFGAFGFIMICKAYISWFANPVLLWSWYMLRKDQGKALTLSLIAPVLAITFLFCDEIFANEGGSTTPITAVGIGYWLWLGSMMVMLVGNILLVRKHQQETV
ncbi:hypothetical protein C8P68_103208 [Mucilaginibacter yixingensis]|uniref:Uncharacterized protein n=1 Tax=Mucilaginibacter yixingensis TaxID=1295612 RepID=A0A2T5JB87_9SPHI|nr:hypothetical protein [Mucilaginibacter yixingensis]PTQ98049.1 hypothetical protein C8P68_103208 [Mucilaginibacter yixingensis]